MEPARWPTATTSATCSSPIPPTSQEQDGRRGLSTRTTVPATASGSHNWETQTAQAGCEGTAYSRALPDIGSRYEETETASSPSLSWPIYNEIGGTYSVWVRGLAPDAAGDSLHVGLDSVAPSSAADLTGFTNDWSWSKVTMSGAAPR